MLDCVIRGGEVIDGTGRPRRRADVGIRDGRIVAIGDVSEEAEQAIDASGCVVAPGFVDIHTHYDAQAFWDTTLSPSPLHGVTTVIGGNCGFSIAPLGPGAGDYLMKMLARVEGMPLESLVQGVPWDWTTTAEYLDRLDGVLAVNAGFLVGHSAIRRVVMGDDATRRHASPGEQYEMERLLAEGLAAGGMGFSSSWATTHNDDDGEPVPSRHASMDELIALCKVVSGHEGTTLEFIPTIGLFEEHDMELMTRMSLAANRPLNWNVLAAELAERRDHREQARGERLRVERGARVLALTIPDSIRTRISFRTGFLLDVLNGWAKPMALPPDEKIALLSDPARRRELNDMAQQTDGPARGIAYWQVFTVAEVFTPSLDRYVGRTVGEIAATEGKEPWDVVCDITVADGLRTIFTPPDRGADDESWKARVDVWRDPRAIVGASDAGAHLDFLATFNYSTTMLAEAVRKRGLLATEEAVSLLTNAQARLYGLTGRGRLGEGWCADIVVFDESTIGPGPVVTVEDLPGGAPRLYGEAEGIEHVLVNGVEIVRGGVFTDARPGRLFGQAETPRASPCRAEPAEGARSSTRELHPRKPWSGAAVRLTHTLPHRNGDGTTSGPLPEVDQVLPRPSAATGPTAATGRHGKSRPAKRTGFQSAKPVPVRAPRARGDLRSRSSERLRTSGWATGHLLVVLMWSHVVDVTGGMVTRDALGRPRYFRPRAD